MLISVQSLMVNRKVGVVDTENKKLVIPLSYDAVAFQKYGIIAHHSGGLSDVYRFDGTPILSNTLNPLMLNGNYVIASDNGGKCYIFDCSKDKPVVIGKSGFDSIYVFFGSNNEPTLYTSKLNLATLLGSKDYRSNGVEFDKYICATRNGYWGVTHRDTKKIVVNFNAKAIYQLRNTQVLVTDINDHVFTL